MKKLIITVATLLLGLTVTAPVFATVIHPIDEVPTVDACGAVFDYTKTHDFNDSRVNINFQDDNQAITITVATGYSLTSVQLDVENDNQNGYFAYTLESGVKFNPNPGHDIKGAKVEVTKVCKDVCNDKTATNYEEVVEGQTQANNELCVFPLPVTPVATPSAKVATPAVTELPNTGAGGIDPLYLSLGMGAVGGVLLTGLSLLRKKK